MASTLPWWRSLSSCFLASRLIYAITISFLRSLWRSAFRMYQGALTMFLKTLFWNLCIMAILLGFMHPHSCKPQAHTGFNICLYSTSLFCVDRADLLPMSQYMCFYVRPTSSRFFWTCTFQHSLASSVMPRYFAVWEWVMVLPFITTGIWWYLLLVKVTWIDLSLLSLISYCRVQLFISSAAICNFSVASTTSAPTAMMAVSSAKVATVGPSGCGRSLVYRRYKTGPSTLPCGTPTLMGLSPEYSSSCLTWK